MRIGNRVRQLRNGRQLSLEELAALTGISRSMLSEIERDAKSPTLRTLTQLATGLDVDLSALLGQEAAGPIIVYRQAERSVERDVETGVEFQVLAPDWRAAGTGIIHVRLPQGGTTGMLSPHPLNTRELIYIMNGHTRANIDGSELNLAPGDSISFSAKVSHELRNTGDAGCEFLIISKGPRPEFLGQNF